jgi:hypothetical protein
MTAAPADERPSADELRSVQEARSRLEAEAAEEAAVSGEPEEELLAHERRSEKAAYLAEKLSEQAEALEP